MPIDLKFLLRVCRPMCISKIQFDIASTCKYPPSAWLTCSLPHVLEPPIQKNSGSAPDNIFEVSIYKSISTRTYHIISQSFLFVFPGIKSVDHQGYVIRVNLITDLVIPDITK